MTTGGWALKVAHKKHSGVSGATAWGHKNLNAGSHDIITLTYSYKIKLVTEINRMSKE